MTADQSRPTPEPQELSAIACRIAQEAADYVRRRRADLFPVSGLSATAEAVSTKSTRTDPVTVADTETEQLIRRLLARQRPGDPILGEEQGDDGGAGGHVRWVVDPIDGTVNFLYGVPVYAVSIAAQIDGVSVAGAVVDVARSVAYWAWTDGGAWAQGPADVQPRRLRANPVDDVALALVATGFGYSAGRRRAQGRLIAELAPQVRDLRRLGAAALDLCMVASGAVDAHIEHGLSPWDWAAGGLIAAEAGATVIMPPTSSTSSDGYPTIAVAPGIADDFLAILTTAGADERLPE
ncbi:inositol monophosphatase SuhB [Gordonia hirsuta DSM 44140 = NBRC 16056]|uniref:Inositol-1-monophosphatase n=1 Tax=Gordonia hirsuta DSM 44140 = NBRC 16056 TaxID=1121927 RepID=L7LE48_9ACTN|nr:inositol monophosphatase family protein [Gordonia hirsuta]GAC58347.1 inositol monophosphatase SuhB [Gordonia hirsuta DSM 44140 = NBRC 16056]